VRCAASHEKIGEVTRKIGLFGPKRERPKQLPLFFKGTSFIEIFNMQGKIVQRFQTDTVLKKISISDLPSGAYLLNIRQDAISHTSKFIKQ
jgi:Secretion system C-terminal sorting domain